MKTIYIVMKENFKGDADPIQGFSSYKKAQLLIKSLREQGDKVFLAQIQIDDAE